LRDLLERSTLKFASRLRRVWDRHSRRGRHGKDQTSLGSGRCRQRRRSRRWRVVVEEKSKWRSWLVQEAVVPPGELAFNSF